MCLLLLVLVLFEHIYALRLSLQQPQVMAQRACLLLAFPERVNEMSFVGRFVKTGTEDALLDSRVLGSETCQLFSKVRNLAK
jgi:hypothetical protein